MVRGREVHSSGRGWERLAGSRQKAHAGHRCLCGLRVGGTKKAWCSGREGSVFADAPQE